jgi:transposase
LLADCSYDSRATIKQAKEQKMKVVIPPKKNQKMPRAYDKALHKLRHFVRNIFLQLKTWRDVVKKHTKNSSPFCRCTNQNVLLFE